MHCAGWAARPQSGPHAVCLHGPAHAAAPHLQDQEAGHHLPHQQLQPCCHGALLLLLGSYADVALTQSCFCPNAMMLLLWCCFAAASRHTLVADVWCMTPDLLIDTCQNMHQELVNWSLGRFEKPSAGLSIMEVEVFHAEQQLCYQSVFSVRNVCSHRT